MSEAKPTNIDIMVKLSKMSEDQKTSNSIIEAHTRAIESMGIRVLDLEKWQIAFKAAESALANANISKPSTSADNAYRTMNKDLLKLIGQIVVVVSMIVGIVYYIVSKTV